MIKRIIAAIFGVLLAALFVLFTTTYTVQFYEVAVKTSYGRGSKRDVVTEAGLKFRVPIADHVSTFDTRLRLAETPHFEAPTADQQSVVIAPFLMWRIDPGGALRFAESFESVEDADESLPDHLKSAATSALGRYRFDDLIGPGSRLDEAEAAILDQLSFLRNLGIEPVTVGLSQVLLPTKATTAVLARMEAVRNALAERERARGEAQAVRIRSEANTIADTLEAFAQQRAAEIRAEADQVAAQHLQAMSVDEELAIFLKSLETIRRSLAEGTTLVFNDAMAPWNLLNLRIGLGMSGIPRPVESFASDGPDGAPPEAGP
jgi:membrane protease subunit HflC